MRLLLKLILSIGIGYYLFQQIDSEFLGLIDNLHWSFFAGFIILGFIMTMVSSVKWAIILGAYGYDGSLGFLYRKYLLSYAVNMLSGSLLGDIQRSFSLKGKLGYRAFIATYLDKATGLVAMSILAFLAVCCYWREFYALMPIIFGIAITVNLIFWGTLYLSFIGPIIGIIDYGRLILAKDTLIPESLLGIPVPFAKSFNKLHSRFGQTLHSKLGGLPPLMNSLEDNLQIFRLENLIGVLAFAFFFHLLTIVNLSLSALSLGITAEWTKLAVVTPLIIIAATVPVFGIQEGSMVFFLTQVGFTASEALGMSLLLRVKSIILGLAGLGLYWRERA